MHLSYLFKHVIVIIVYQYFNAHIVSYVQLIEINVNIRRQYEFQVNRSLHAQTLLQSTL